MPDTFKSLRISNGYTQADLASKLGVTIPTVSVWERGLSSPSPRYIPQLAEIFNVPKKEIFYLLIPKNLIKLDKDIK